MREPNTSLLNFNLKCYVALAVSPKASPPGRHQEQAPKQRCTFRPTTFSSVQFSSVQFSPLPRRLHNLPAQPTKAPSLASQGYLAVMFYFYFHHSSFNDPAST